MGPAFTIVTILAAVGAGLLLSRVPALARLASRPVFASARMVLLCAMVAAMGFRVGRTDEVARNAGTLGLTSLLFAAATMAGTLGVLTLVFTLRRTPPAAARGAPTRAPAGRVAAWREPALLLGMLTAGVLIGWLSQVFPTATGERLVTGLLYALLVVVGVGLGGTEMPGLRVPAQPDLLLIPLGTAVGSLSGGLAVGLALGLPPGPALSVAAGFGWYSLSGVILTRLDSPSLGAVSFLANMARESAALILIPLLARTRFPLLAVGAGGATSMDVTLFLTVKNVGAWSAPYCIASGAFLSLMVPVAVPLLHAI